MVRRGDLKGLSRRFSLAKTHSALKGNQLGYLTSAITFLAERNVETKKALQLLTHLNNPFGLPLVKPAKGAFCGITLAMSST